MIHFERKTKKKKNLVLGYAIMLCCFVLFTILGIIRHISTGMILLSAAMAGVAAFFLIREKKKAKK